MNPANAAPARGSFAGPGSALREPLVLAALALFILRLAYFARPDLFPEEAYYWNYGQHLALSYLDHPPMVAWLIRLGGALCGHGELGVRLPAVACSLVTAFFACKLTALFYGRQAAWTALLLTQLLPFFFLSGWVMTPDAPLTACWAGTLFFLARVCFAGDARAWWGVSVCLGLGMLSKYTLALLGPSALLFLALDPPSRRWFRRPEPYAAVALAVLIFSPVIVWNAGHHWASFAFQSTGRLAKAARFSTPGLLGAIVLMLTPLGIFLTLGPLCSRRQIPPSAETVDDAEPRRRLFARVFTLVPLAVFTVFSLTHQTKINWTGPLWLALLPLLSERLEAAFTQPALFRSARAARWTRGTALATAGLLAAAYVLFFQYLAFGLPGMPYSRRLELLPVGWPQLAQALDQQVDALHRAQTAPVLVVGLDRDFVASEAAFYRADPARATRDTTGVHLFGGTSLMYAYWFPPQTCEGATLLLVSLDRADFNSNRRAAHCRSVGPVQTGWLRVRGKAVCPFYTQVGYGYRVEPYFPLRPARKAPTPPR